MLTIKGGNQANLTANAITCKDMPKLPNVVRVVSSSMPRAHQTATIIHSAHYKKVPFLIDKLMVEGEVGKDEDMLRFEHAFSKHVTMELVEPVMSECQTEIIVCNIIRFFVSK